MKKAIILFLFIVASTTQVFSQSEKKKEVEYLDVWIYYSVKDVIGARMSIDLGTSKFHSLFGIVSNGDADNIIFNEDGITKIYNNEIDLFKHLADLGWEIYNVQSIRLISRDYLKYLMIKTE